MFAPRRRGALSTIALGLMALVSACSNGTEPKPIPCDTTPRTLSAGEVVADIAGGCVYVAGGTSGAEFALVPFNTDTHYVRTATLNFADSGASRIATPLQSRTFASTPVFSLSPSENGLGVLEPSRDIDIVLRESERHVLKPLIPAAREWFRNRAASAGGRLSPSFSTIAATWSVGDTVTLNTNVGSTDSAQCIVTDNRRGRVAAITTHAIVVDDINNPTGGYTDTDYQGIGAQFDTVFTMDVAAFGDPSDIDANGKIIMFFTRAVNEMTPNGSQSVVGGFFNPRDLFPRDSTNGLQGCRSSNFAEMFYLLVPDPNGVVNGNIRTKFFVQHLTNSTTAHEFQHLINGSRRIYVNNASDFEVVWLNEGLSHIAEELLFYKQSAGLAPRMNIDSTELKGTQNQPNIDSYNFNQFNNIGRLAKYLAKPDTSSPYAPNDFLPTRGATWSFLRYAADHRGTSDGDTWFKLVNSTSNGLTNLQNVFGSPISAKFRDWAVATIADDVPGSSSSQWQDPSWNYRSLFDYLTRANQPPAYPLSTVSVGDGVPQAVTLNGGGAAYVRFTIPANQVGSVKWTATSNSAVAVSIVRLK